MRVIVGVHVAEPVELRVDVVGDAASELAMLTRRDAGAPQWVRLPGTRAWTLPLSPGDIVLDLTAESIRVSASAPVTFVSASGHAWRDTEATLPGSAIAPATSDALDASAAAWFQRALRPMAQNSGPVPIHALLIGIDDYPPGPDPARTIYRSLGGCVRDIAEVDAFLRERVGVPPERITRLLAPRPGHTAPDCPLPTYENVVKAWQDLIDRVPLGEQVYIHYSGHGGRVKTLYPEAKGDAARDEALALSDVNDGARGRYLRDVEVARLLDLMVERGLLVTLVVDSCHSGGLPRADAVPRCGDRPDDQPRPADRAGSLVGTRDELLAVARRLAGPAAPVTRGAAEVSWSFGASAYTLIAACRQNEYAFEYPFDGVNRQGALSYVWLQTLAERGPSLSYRQAHRRIESGVQARFRDQHPVLVGDLDREVLGIERTLPVHGIPVTAVAGERITLGAGLAQLLHQGTRLAIVSVAPALSDVDLSTMPEVEVRDVATTTAVAWRVGDSGGPIAVGARAVILAHSASLTQFVRVPPSLDAVERAIRSEPSNLIALAGRDEVASYSVAIADDCGVSSYRILDLAGDPVPHLRPPIAIDAPDAAVAVARRLLHLARFASVRTLRNSDTSSPLAGRLTLELLAMPLDYQPGDTAAPEPLAPGRGAVFAAGTYFCVRIRNLSAVDLHVVVLDLQPDWAITKLAPSESDTVHLARGETLDRIMYAWLPDGYDQGTDVLKAIGTIEPTRFDWLALDALDRPAAATRGAPCTVVERVMHALRNPSMVSRNASEAQIPTRGWTTADALLEVRRSH